MAGVIVVLLLVVAGCSILVLAVVPFLPSEQRKALRQNLKQKWKSFFSS